MFVVLSRRYFPLILISPLSGSKSPAIKDSNVDLPMVLRRKQHMKSIVREENS